MTPAATPRLAASPAGRADWAGLLGLACTAVVAVWWLGSLRIALERGADPLPASTDTLFAAWLARAMVLPPLALRAGLCGGWRSAAATMMMLVLPAWPLVLLAGAAASTPWLTVAAAELALSVAALGLPILGRALRGVTGRDDFAEVLTTFVGVLLSAAVWYSVPNWAAL